MPLPPALRFQPIRRPQANQKKVTKPVFPKTIASASTATTSENRDAAATTARADTPPDNTKPPAGAVPRSTLADWAGGDDDDAYLWGGAGAGEKRQRGGRKAAKKRRREQEQRQRAGQQTDWDEIYDPSRPTNVDEYLRSDERVREVQEWKAVLYAHRRRDRLAGRRGSGSSYGESDEDSEAEQRPAMGSKCTRPAVPSGEYQMAFRIADGSSLAAFCRPVRTAAVLLLRATTSIPLSTASSWLTRRGACARRRYRRRCLRTTARPLRHGHASSTTLSRHAHAAAAAAPSSPISTTCTSRGRRDHLPRASPLRSTAAPSATTRRNGYRSSGRRRRR